MQPIRFRRLVLLTLTAAFALSSPAVAAASDVVHQVDQVDQARLANDANLRSDLSDPSLLSPMPGSIDFVTETLSPAQRQAASALLAGPNWSAKFFPHGQIVNVVYSTVNPNPRVRVFRFKHGTQMPQFLGDVEILRDAENQVTVIRRDEAGQTRSTQTQSGPGDICSVYFAPAAIAAACQNVAYDPFPPSQSAAGCAFVVMFQVWKFQEVYCKIEDGAEPEN